MDKLKIIAILFATVSVADMVLMLLAIGAGNMGFAVVYLLFSGYFAFRAKQCWVESK